MNTKELSLDFMQKSFDAGKAWRDESPNAEELTDIMDAAYLELSEALGYMPSLKSINDITGPLIYINAEDKGRAKFQYFKGASLTRMDSHTVKNAEESVALAAATDEKRPVLQHVHTESGVMVAADGFRLHTAPGKGKTCKVCKKEHYTYPDYKQIIPTSFKYQATFEADDMYTAAKLAGVFAREGSNVAKVRANGKIEVIGKSEECGESVNEVKCESNGQEITFGINWQFLRDAVYHCAPEGGPITMKLGGPDRPILFEANNRQAVVMPMHFG